MRRREQEDYGCLSVTVYHARREAYITNCNLEETELVRRTCDRKNIAPQVSCDRITLEKSHKFREDVTTLHYLKHLTKTSIRSCVLVVQCFQSHKRFINLITGSFINENSTTNVGKALNHYKYLQQNKAINSICVQLKDCFQIV